MKHLLKNEAGAALIVALGALVILSLLGAAALTVAHGSINQTVWDRSSNQAFGVAEAGFNQAIYRARAKTLTPGTYKIVMANGEASVTVTGAGGIFTVKATGAQPNLASPKARRAIEGRINVLNPYDMMFANGIGEDDEGGIELEGNATINGPVYARDLLSLKGTGVGGKITGGPVYIKDNPATTNPTGDLLMSGDAQIGTPGSPVTMFIDGYYSVTGNAELYASPIYSNVPDLTMPTVTLADMPAYRTRANVVIDGDAVTDGDYNKPNGLILDGSHVSQNWTNGSYYLRWTRSADKKSAVLEINGTIFVDGDVRVGSASNNDLNITFSGNGTIVANGKIAIESNFTPVGGGGTFPATNLIGFVSPKETEVEPKAGSTVYAILYGYEEVEIEKQCTFYGSAMSNAIEIENNPQVNIVTNISAYLPPGMPAVQGNTSLTDWREVRP